MLELYQRERCPSCTRVRHFLLAQGIRYVVVPVPRLGSARANLLALGVDKPTVPALVDGDKVIQGEDKILAHLREHHLASRFGDPIYGLTRKLEGVTYADAIVRVTAALKEQGFGVLTEIDVRATLKKKIDVDYPPYIILGACNPSLAHKALTAAPGIGLLLPCNVVVAEDSDGSTVVSAIDPLQMFSVVHDPAMEPLANEVRGKLAAAIAAL